MAWINLVAERYRVRDLARSAVDYLRSEPEGARLGPTPVLSALVAGDKKLFQQALDLSRLEFDGLAQSFGETLGSVAVLPDLLSLSVGYHLAGEPQTGLWERIAKCRKCENSHMEVLMRLAGELTGGGRSERTQGVNESGAVRGSKRTLEIAVKLDLEYAFDHVSCPDHEEWPHTLSSLVMPIGLLLYQDQVSAGRKPDVFRYFYAGSRPDLHPSVVYEREWKRPAWDSEPSPEDKESWFGFDAVELTWEGVRVYHYLTLKWQAPLLFDSEVDAFRFLTQVDRNWRFVRESVSEREWRQIEQSLSDEYCEHVIVHDSARAPCLDDHLQRAGKHYGLNLTACDLMDI